MSGTPSPPGWVIPNGSAQGFSFTGAVNGVNSLSDQALTLPDKSFPHPVILPDNSPGNISETRVELAAMISDGVRGFAGIVFGFQDIDNYLAVETQISGESDGYVGQIAVNEKVTGNLNQLARSGSFLPGLDPSQGWVDIRFQVFRPSSSETAFRVSAADHGGTYQQMETVTFQDSELSFTSGDVGLTSGHGSNGASVTFDGDAVGSGGRPIRMYWP